MTPLVRVLTLLVGTLMAKSLPINTLLGNILLIMSPLVRVLY
jgi:hypothetical protein